MDTIIRGYDIPKLYCRKVDNPPFKYDVIDGQQRLRAIWDFMQNVYGLPKDAEPVEGFEVAGKKYEDLPEDVRNNFDGYDLDFAMVASDDDDEVREMFLRLQNGTSLKSQEKRNAMPGKMRDFVKEVSRHSFFQGSVNFKDSRFTYDLIAAQMCMLEIVGEPCAVKDASLNKMYSENKDFDKNSKVAKKVFRVLDYLLKMYPEKSPDLTRYNVVSLYVLISSMMDKYVIKGREKSLRKWFSDFEAYRTAEEAKPLDEQNSEVVAYHERISNSSDGADSIKFRYDYLTKLLFVAVPDITQKDPQREFDMAQRAAIYRRDKGICQLHIKCNGAKCAWDNWHADHKVPWSQGGKTIVDNGQVACPECNLAKGSGV